MLTAVIRVREIDYEKTICGLFPEMKERMEARGSNEIAAEVLHILGSSALPALCGFVSSVPREKKNELLVWGINRYSKEITEKLNTVLSEKKASLEGLRTFLEDDSICVEFTGISADYAGIIREKAGGFAGMVSSAVGDGGLEKLALKLLWTEKNRKKLINAAGEKLREYGVVMEIENVEVRRDAVC